jgi:hypothetical protein
MKINSHALAIGWMVLAWNEAQKYWLPDMKLIPKERWIEMNFPNEIIECNLATEFPDGIKLRGIKKHFQWWFDGMSQRIAAGKKSAENRKIKFGSAIPHNASNSRTKPNEAFGENRTDSERDPNETEPSSSSSSSSSSSKKEIKENTIRALAVSKTPTELDLKMAKFIKTYAEVFNAKYKTNPVITGKQVGLVKTILKSMSADKACELVQVYLQMTEKWFETKSHDIETFYGNLQKISVAAANGSEQNDPFRLIREREERRCNTKILKAK